MELTHPLAVVTPTLDGDVLRVLALAEADFTASRLQSMLSAPSKRGIDKVLTRLVGQGIVLQVHVGRPSLYRLNRDHLAAEAISALAKQKETLIARLQQVLSSWAIPPVFAALFGSGARDDHTGTSDIDLLIVHPDHVDETIWDMQVESLSARVTAWTGNDTRAICYSSHEVISLGAQESLFAEVLKDGIPLAGELHWLRNAVKRTAAK